MILRAARKSDSDSWEQMREALWPSEPGAHAREIERYFDGELHEPLEVFLALDQTGAALGVVELSIRPYAEGCETDRVAFLEGWYVDPAVRRAGVGAALIGAAEEWARSQGCTELASSAEVENRTSGDAHIALGFTEAATVRCFIKSL